MDPKAIWQEIRAGGERSYIVLSASATKTLQIDGSGRCGLAKLRRYLSNENVQFGGFRVHEVNASGARQQKLVSFVLNGANSSIKTKMAGTAVKGQAKAVFDGAHVELDLNNVDDLTEANVIARLNALRGSARADSYVFGTGNPEDLDLDELAALAEAQRLAEEEASRKAAEDARLAAEEAARLEVIRKAEEERQARLAVLPQRAAVAVKVAPLAADGMVGSFDMSELEGHGVRAAIGDVDDGRFAWVLVSVHEDAPNKVRVDASGNGSIPDVTASLADDNIQYGIVRVTAVERRGKVLSLRPRGFFFNWAGPTAPHKAKIRANGLEAALRVYLKGLVTVETSIAHDRNLLTEAMVHQRVRGAIAVGTDETNLDLKFGFYDKDTQADEYIAYMSGVKASAAAVDASKSAKAAGKAVADLAAQLQETKVSLAETVVAAEPEAAPEPAAAAPAEEEAAAPEPVAEDAAVPEETAEVAVEAVAEPAAAEETA